MLLSFNHHHQRINRKQTSYVKAQTKVQGDFIVPCTVQVASSGAELSLLLFPKPGTDYQWNLDIYVPHHCSSTD